MQVEIDSATREWIAKNPDLRWQQLLDYWHSLATASSRLPQRREIDPAALSPDLLPSIFLIDVVRTNAGTPPRFPFRLLGSNVVDRESTKVGQYVDQLGPAVDVSKMVAQYRDCLAGKIRVRDSTLIWDSVRKEHIKYRVMLLPLAENGEIVNMIGLAIYEA